MKKIKYELIQEREAIGKVLDRIFECDSEITIFEDTAEKRTVFKANIVFVNHFNHEMILKPSDFRSPFLVSKNYKIYITNHTECMHFTCSLGTITSSHFLILRWPISIFQQHTRIHKRIDLQDKNCPINFSNFSLNANSIEQTIQEAKLMDISKTGLGFTINHDITELYKPNDCLIFTYINEIPLIDKLTGNIIYIRKIKPIMSSNNYTVGIHFNQEINLHEILSSLGHTPQGKEDINDLKRLF